jgi:hypothetical protein
MFEQEKFTENMLKKHSSSRKVIVAKCMLQSASYKVHAARYRCAYGKEHAARSMWQTKVTRCRCNWQGYAARCMLQGAWCKMHVVRCRLQGACFKVHVAGARSMSKAKVARCMLQGSCCKVHVARCMLQGACCKVHVARCMLQGGACLKVHVARCMLQDPPSPGPCWKVQPWTGWLKRGWREKQVREYRSEMGRPSGPII